jgi:predicted nuclease of predicted toxin-antitoxin system
MKLLLDENLSRRILPFLLKDYPDSSHVSLEGLESASDNAIWEYAKQFGFVIVTRDADFEEMSLVKGHPPKIIWLKTHNYSKASVLGVLISHKPLIESVLLDANQGCIEIASTKTST